MRREQFLRAGLAVLAGGAAGIEWPSPPVLAGTASGQIPNVDVVDQHGQRLRFYDDLIRGRVALVNFFFTSCGETCPLVTQNLREVQDRLGARMGRDIVMCSVSLQPELETPAMLKNYADHWGVLPGWRFLTGRSEDIERLRQALGFFNEDPAYDRVKDNHTGLVRYGNDRVDRWAGTPGMGRPAWIVKAVTTLADIG